MSAAKCQRLHAKQPDSDPKIAVPNPRFVLFVNSVNLLAAHYKKHLEAQIREQMPYDGLLIIFHFREREKRSETRPAKRSTERPAKRSRKHKDRR